MVDNRAAFSTGTNRPRTETTVDIPNSTTGERVETPPPTYDGLNLLPTYDDACKLPSMVALNQSVGTTLTRQIRSTSDETYSNVFGVPNSSTTSQHWVSASSSSQPTVQDSRTSVNNGVANSATTNNISDRATYRGILGQISESERAQRVSTESGNKLCLSVMGIMGVVALLAVLLVSCVPDKSIASTSDSTWTDATENFAAQYALKQYHESEERRRRDFRIEVKKRALMHVINQILKNVNKSKGNDEATDSSAM